MTISVDCEFAPDSINRDFQSTLAEMTRGALILTLPLLLFVITGETRAQGILCGLSPSDWCVVQGDDPCSRHRDAAACKADRQCYGIPYRGESVVACLDDGEQRGFASNCPTIGCSRAPPQDRLPSPPR